MKLIRNLDEIAKVPRRGAISIGNFDGVHRGHARIVKRLVAMAAEAGGPAIVFTFDPHPVRLLRPEVAPPPLTWIDRKAELLGRLGIDFIVAYPTTPSLLELSAEAFFQQIVIETLGVAAMAEGPNFCFGKDRLGTIERLQELCEDAHVELEIVDPLMVGSTYVSSSRTRDLLREGDVDAAVALLTEPYRVRGIVTHGAGRGGGLGFPTANI